MNLSDDVLNKEIAWLERQSSSFANLLSIAKELRELRDTSRAMTAPREAATEDQP
jgi:hypothetical protein